MTSPESARLLRAPRTMPEGRFSTIAWVAELPPVDLLGTPISVRSMNADLLATISELLGSLPRHTVGALGDDDPGLVSVIDRGETSKRRFALYSGRSRVVIAKEAAPILDALWNALPFLVSTGSDKVVVNATVAGATSGGALISGRLGGPVGPFIEALADAGHPFAPRGVVGVHVGDALVMPTALPRPVDGEWTGADVGQTDDPAPIRVIIAPTPLSGVDVELTELRRAEGLVALCEQSLNLHRHGQAGLDALARVVEGAEGGCWRVRYDAADPDAAVSAVSALLAPV